MALELSWRTDQWLLTCTEGLSGGVVGHWGVPKVGGQWGRGVSDVHVHSCIRRHTRNLTFYCIEQVFAKMEFGP